MWKGLSPERPLPEAVAVKPMLQYRPQDNGDARPMYVIADDGSGR